MDDQTKKPNLLSRLKQQAIMLKDYIHKQLWLDYERDDNKLLNSFDPTPTRKVLTLLKLNYSILIAEIRTFKSFKVVIKYVLIAVLLAITFGFSPVAFPNGFAKFDVNQVCKNSNVGITPQEELLNQLADIKSAENQVRVAKEGVDKLKAFVRDSYFKVGVVNDPTVIGNRPPSDNNQVFPSFPTGCSNEQLERTFNAALSQKCIQKVCVDDNLLNILCKTIDVPCQTSDLMDASGNWRKYREFQEQKIASNNNTVEEVTVGSVSQGQKDLLQNTLNSLSFKVNVALSCYNFYKVVAIAVAPPLTVLTGPVWSSLTKLLTSITQPVFVVGIVVVWQLIEYLVTPDIVLLLSKFSANPCFFDEKSTNERIKLVPSICNKVNTLRSDYLKLKYEYTNIEIEVRAYGQCYAEYWKQRGVANGIPAESSFSSDLYLGDPITFNQVKDLFVNDFRGKCDPKLFLQGVALPTDNTPRVPPPSGPIIAFLCWVLLPTIVFQYVYRGVSFFHPQVLYNGKYEMIPGEIIPEDKIGRLEAMIVKHLRRMQVLPVLFWVTLGFICMILASVYKY